MHVISGADDGLVSRASGGGQKAREVQRGVRADEAGFIVERQPEGHEGRGSNYILIYIVAGV